MDDFLAKLKYARSFLSSEDKWVQGMYCNVPIAEYSSHSVSEFVHDPRANCWCLAGAIVFGFGEDQEYKFSKEFKKVTGDVPAKFNDECNSYDEFITKLDNLIESVE